MGGLDSNAAFVGSHMDTQKLSSGLILYVVFIQSKLFFYSAYHRT
jgi:hypothetical protein